MRCPKCGTITFDYVETCPKCAKDLSETRQALGGMVKPNQEVAWFKTREEPTPSGNSAVGASMGPRQGGPVGLSAIDVSDLVTDQEEATQELTLEEIDSGELEAVAEDEEFQRALGQVLGPGGEKRA